MRVLVDTGIFSASLSRRKRDQHLRHLTDLVGHQLFLAAQTVAELRFGALVAGWGEARRHRLAHAVSLTTVVPVTDRLITEVAHLRWECRLAGHPLASEAHTGDLWIAASARLIEAPLSTADRIFLGAPGVTLRTPL